ncbi:response regulator [Salmonella enterica]|nr:response regulator [Salmonella enterica]EBV4143488.1 hypothetical protein [Salmonella enterica subsp. enterica serovar Benin]ECG5862807.1 response regulator [Salmonella enterica subsp. enterica serovar Oranienburg]EBE6989557.1 response regulator [Salmonella enterica]EBE7298955.1 response regulator [Salmonella enterica]
MAGAKKILLVEDDSDIASLLQLSLKDEGYEIIHESDGVRAVEQLEKQVWDAVILDLMLPGVDGLEICRRIRQMVATRHLQLHLDVEGPLPLVNADLSMMERVVTNLLDNAIRHTPDGGDVWLKVWRDENRLQAEVCDSGPGVEEGIREVLFQRPTALLPQETRTERGGLGLLIVRRMLELHGGDINLINSTAGACFRFSLPL